MSPNPPPRFLMVEHDPDLLEVLAAPLTTRGIDVLPAFTWSDAVDVLGRRELPTGIIVDVSSPGFDHSPLASQLTDDLRLRALPVVVVASTSELRRELPPSTTAVLIGRPIRGRLLLDVVERIVRRRTEAALAHATLRAG